MKLKLAGVAFGALMVGLVGAGEAKADAVAIATINVTSATLSATGVDGTALNINQVLTHLSTNGASLSATASVAPYGTVNEGPYTASNAGAVSINNVGTVTETATPASIGGSTSTSTSSITGSLLTGGVTNAIATTQLNLLNGTQGNANQAKTDTQTQFTFTAGQNAILSLTVAGFYEVYAATSNSTNSAQVANAHVALSFSVGNTSYSAIGTNGVSATVLSAVGTDGSTSQQSFAGSPYTFAVTAGQTYIFNVVEEVSANASAVPEPGTLALFGAGLAGLGFLGFRRQNKRGNLAA